MRAVVAQWPRASLRMVEWCYDAPLARGVPPGFLFLARMLRAALKPERAVCVVPAVAQDAAGTHSS
ncbi:hypothetical protein [Paracandidimonas soli]|uniref:hypothetical protein n=1 Tax=Paracandidimonas soli TaxID=1917182 RepID=UPI001047828B|nr:hypothetical protein [Paracandidimonas soli]